MCFENRRTLRSRRPARVAPILLLAGCLPLAGVLLTACGKKGDPMPPLRTVPRQTTDLMIRQQGSTILLDMTYPSVTAAGLALSHVDAVELFQLVKPTAGGKILEVPPAELESSAELQLTLRGVELDSAVTGDRIQIRVPLADDALQKVKPKPKMPEPATETVATEASTEGASEPETAEDTGEMEAAETAETTVTEPASEPAEPTEPAEPEEELLAYYFAVRTVLEDETSSFSNLVSLIPRIPPPPPASLDAAAGADGITVTWSAVDSEEIEGYDVFRRESQERSYSTPLRRLAADKTELLDQTARFGTRYIYTVRTIATLQPLVYSPESAEREIDYQDRYAPPVPGNFVALGERARVRLRWDASPATDVAGYMIFRREPGRDFHSITPTPVTGLELIDPGLATGVTFDYRIRVVDQSGNESPLSDPVSTTVR